MIRSARSGVLVVLALVAVTVGVAACGSSSKPAAGTHPTSHAGFAARFTALRACLEKHGVTGFGAGHFGAGHFGGRPGGQAGTNHFHHSGTPFSANPKLQAAMKDCAADLGGGAGGGYPGAGGGFGGGYPGAGGPGGPPNGGPANP